MALGPKCVTAAPGWGTGGGSLQGTKEQLKSYGSGLPRGLGCLRADNFKKSPLVLALVPPSRTPTFRPLALRACDSRQGLSGPGLSVRLFLKDTISPKFIRRGLVSPHSFLSNNFLA